MIAICGKCNVTDLLNKILSFENMKSGRQNIGGKKIVLSSFESLNA